MLQKSDAMQLLDYKIRITIINPIPYGLFDVRETYGVMTQKAKTYTKGRAYQDLSKT